VSNQSATRIAINGFRRMGRLALRAAWGRPELSFVHINELHGDRDRPDPSRAQCGGYANRLVEFARTIALRLPAAEVGVNA